MAEQPKYRIAKWNETFENADTRKRVRLGWFLVPSGCDSTGYIELMSRGDEGVKAYAVFLAICQWSATCLPVVRGSCARSDGRPLGVRQIAASIRMDVGTVERALELLSSPDVQWMECEKPSKNGGKNENCQPSAGDLPVVCQSSADDLPQGEGEGEGEGEGNTHTHTNSNPIGFEKEWDRWCDYREAIDGRRPDPISSQANIMNLMSRGTEKAKRDIDFSIRKSAKTILDSDHDFEKRNGQPKQRRSKLDL